MLLQETFPKRCGHSIQQKKKGSKRLDMGWGTEI
jgi:hypothetical protein